MPKAGDDIVICVGRESIEALAHDAPVAVGENEYLIRADSYDYPYKQIEELKGVLACLLDHYLGCYEMTYDKLALEGERLVPDWRDRMNEWKP